MLHIRDMNYESKNKRTVIFANGTSANEGNRPYTSVRTESLSPEGIRIVCFVCTPKVV